MTAASVPRRAWRVWKIVWSNPITWAALGALIYFDGSPRWGVLIAGFNFGCSLYDWTERHAR